MANRHREQPNRQDKQGESTVHRTPYKWDQPEKPTPKPPKTITTDRGKVIRRG